MKTFHVVPTDDIYPHLEVDYTCQCQPEVEYNEGCIIVTHNAWDGRELIDEVEGRTE